MIISLTGFMGSGKSSVGRRLSALLCCSFADLDPVIEESEGRSITEIFATDGEKAFRRMEMETLQDLISQYSKPDTERTADLVLALGGGTVMTQECADMIRSHTFCIYLRATVDTLTSHLVNEAGNRPMLTAQGGSDEEALRKRITELMDIRSFTYEKNAHIIIDTDGRSIEEISDLIAGKL